MRGDWAILRAAIIGIILAVTAPTLARSQAAAPASVAIFAGQSNEVSHGTLTSGFGFAGIPGGVGSAGVNAVASCWESKVTPSGATPGSGALTCGTPSSGRIYAGQIISAPGVPPGQAVSAANNNDNFPGVTGSGFAAGTYVVTPAASAGSAAAPITMTFAEPDIGGSGSLNPHCQIWAPKKSGTGTWQTYSPKVNSNFNGGAQGPSFGPEGAFCQRWTADNPGKTLYMIKIAIGGSSLCDRPDGNNYSPEYAGAAGIASFQLLQTQVAKAEAALATQLGISSYAVKVIQWGQGEQDAASPNTPCGFPTPPFSTTTTPVPYLANLEDLVNRFAIPATIAARFSGSVAGTVLTVAAVGSGILHPYQLVTGAGVAPGVYLANQISGPAGGPGQYNLKVYQAVSSEIISGSGGAACKTGSISGTFFFAQPLKYKARTVLESCVTGGAFKVGDVLSGERVLPGTTIVGLDSAGHTADGLYTVNVNQTVASLAAPEAMSAQVDGFGNGSDSARFVMFRTFRNARTVPTGVQIGQDYVNDNAVTSIPTATVNTDDALKAELNQIHFHAAWISELGRRLYKAYLGTCDYHSPTC